MTPLDSRDFWTLHTAMQRLGISADEASRQLKAIQLAGLSAQQALDRLTYWNQEEDPFKRNMRAAIARHDEANHAAR